MKTIFHISDTLNAAYTSKSQNKMGTMMFHRHLCSIYIGIDLVECFWGLRYFSGTMTELRKALKDIAENELEVNTKDGKNGRSLHRP
jgi:hypothetical protein